MDVVGLVRFLRRRWLPIFLCVVAGIAGAAVLSASASDTYRSSTRLFVNLPAAPGVQEALQGVELSSQLIESYAHIAESRSNAERVADELGGDLTTGEVRDKLSASPIANTLLLDVTATDSDAARARDLANASAAVLIEAIDELESGKQDAVEARVIDPAVTPSAPVSPRPVVDLTIGFLLGLTAGLLLAVGLDAADHARTGAPVTPGDAGREHTGAPVSDGNGGRRGRLRAEPLP